MFLVRTHSESIVQDYKKNNLKSILSEMFSRKNVFIYMIKHGQSNHVKQKCLELYFQPINKLIKINKTTLLWKEVFTLFTLNRTIMLKNTLWFIKTFILLFVNNISGKGEYQLKNQLLKFQLF